jgi:YggT family protein
MLFVEIARMLIETVAALLGVTLLLRAYMNWLGMPARNPLAQFVLALTDWMVAPLRRVVPAVGRIDAASLVGAYLVAVLQLVLIFVLIGAGVADWPWVKVLLVSLAQLLRWGLYLVMWLTIIHVVLSWVNPFAPVAPAMAMLVRPFLAPFQRVVPLIGGVDLSPVLLILVVNVFLLVFARAGF